MGPWGYVLANHQAGRAGHFDHSLRRQARVFRDHGHPPEFRHQQRRRSQGQDLCLRRQGFDFGLPDPAALLHDPGHYPDKYFSKVVHTSHQAIETQVTQGVLDAGADYNRNRNAMIEQGLIKAELSKIIWTSAPLPNDAFAVSKALPPTRR
jgi:phosphonate transport system substrate-binding protein